MFKKDIFIEKIVRRSLGPFEIFIKTMVFITTAVVFLVINMIPLIFYPNIMTILFGISLGFLYLGYRLFISVNSEYEYSLTNDEFTVERIIAKRKRSHVFTANVKNFDIVAPVDSQEYFDALNSEVLLFDYSSGKAGSDMWFLLTEQNGKRKIIVFEFDVQFIEGFRKYIPRRVSQINPMKLEKSND